MLTRKLFALAFSVFCASQAAEASSAFTYFGELYNGNAPANGTYRFAITPYADAAGTHALSSPVSTGAVRVVNGKFRTPVSFDFATPADRRVWLGVEATAADGSVTAFPANKEILLPIPNDTADARPLTPQGGTMIAAASRFSLMWLSGGVPHRAAIRGDGSIRDTDDAGLIVTIVGTGQFCIQATSPQEGAVGVAQYDGDNVPRTIDVTMGIGNPCSAAPGAQIFVQTWIQ